MSFPYPYTALLYVVFIEISKGLSNILTFNISARLRSRLAYTLIAGATFEFRGLKFELDAAIVQKGANFK